MEWLACSERGENGEDIHLIQCHFLIKKNVSTFPKDLCSDDVILSSVSNIRIRTFFPHFVGSNTCCFHFIFLLMNAVDINR